MFYVSICLIVRDEHRYIEEWLSYHRLIGIDHFYITDNKSQPPLQSILQPYIDQGLVTYRYDTRDRPQIAVYNECLRDHGKDNTWIAFIDSDEFLVLKKDRNIKEFLKRYEEFGSVFVGWYLFGSNGYRKKQKSIIDSYTKRVPQSNRVKSIVRPVYAKKFDSAHRVSEFVKGYYPVDETKKQFSILKMTRKVSTNLIQLNHYVLRSRQDFLEKVKRGGGVHPSWRSMNFFRQTNLQATIPDTTIISLKRKLTQK